MKLTFEPRNAMIRVRRFSHRRSFHWVALCELDRSVGAPNDVDARIFGWHLLVRLPVRWW